MYPNILRIDKSSDISFDNKSHDRPPEDAIPSNTAASYDITNLRPAQRVRARDFTLFKLLPAELRAFVWEFACAPPGPRIHYLDPIAAPNDDGHGLWWDVGYLRWRENYSPGCEQRQRVRWEISEYTKDLKFKWTGRELLAVCVEARNTFLRLGQKLTNSSLYGGRPRHKLSDMIQTTDVICIRAGASNHDLRQVSPPGMRQICPSDERPAPRRLALEIPTDARYRILCPSPQTSQGRSFLPHWLCVYRQNQKFMQFEVVYILDQHIKPWAHYDHQAGMPPGMYAEAFEGHHGSKFVSVDPDNKHAVRLWNIPEYCWEVLENVRSFPDLPQFYTGKTSLEFSDHWRSCYWGFFPKAKMRFLACVNESSQSQEDYNWRPKSGFPFTW